MPRNAAMAVLRVGAGSGCEYHIGTGHEYRAENIHFKAVQCSEDGFWALDIVNNNFAPSYVEYFFGSKMIKATLWRVTRVR